MVYSSQVSVIIPVYQASEFVETAVLSAVNFAEVGEIILIEDGSSDDSYITCQNLESNYEKVRLLVHENRKNLGASASRNVGIMAAKFPFIAFLDADDCFLPNRFNQFSILINKQTKFDGLYETIQYFGDSTKIYGINRKLDPNNLLYFLIRGTYGHFHTNGLIVKTDLLKTAGLFDESLDLHEDSDLWMKIAYYGELISGEIGVPVSLVRKHKGNRIWTGTTTLSRLKQMLVTWGWLKNQEIEYFTKLTLLAKIIVLRIRVFYENNKS